MAKREEEAQEILKSEKKAIKMVEGEMSWPQARRRGFDRKTWEKTKKGRKIKKIKKKRYPKEMEHFIIENIDNKTNKELIGLIWKMFKIKTTAPRLSNYLSNRNIKRSRRIGK